MAILRVRGSIYFGAIEHVQAHLQRVDEIDPQRKWLLLVAQGINFVDLAGAHTLAEEAWRRRVLGGGLALVGAQQQLLNMLAQGGELDVIGRERVFAHKGEALRSVYPCLDADICRRCTVRAFHECQAALPNGELRKA